MTTGSLFPRTAGVRPEIWAAFDRLVSEIAKTHRISRREILSPARHRSVAWPRQELFALALDAGVSSADVGRMVGRDHSTVLYGAQQHRDREAFSARGRHDDRP